MEYVKMLSREQIEELVKIFAVDYFKEIIDIEEKDYSVIVTVSLEYTDSAGHVSIEEKYELFDYDVKFLNHGIFNEEYLVNKYKKKMIDYFGNDYSVNSSLEAA